MDAAIRALTKRLRELPESAFDTLLAPNGDFSNATKTQTTFLLGLTLGALQAGPGLEEVVARLASRLKEARSEKGSWNYWMPQAADRKARPLPDDLDTTATVLHALTKMPEAVPGAWVADAIRLLIFREQQPGGPYRTWIVPPDAKDVWQDVDPIVNANIGRLLSGLDVSLEPLLQFLDTAIRDHKLGSPYYPGRTIFRYFLASWYRGPLLQEFTSESTKALTDALRGESPQALAFALATASMLPDTELSDISQGATLLAERVMSQELYPEAVCIDAIHGEKKDHAGSHAFSLALCREALLLAQKRLKIDEKPITQDAGAVFHEKIVTAAYAHCQRLPANLRQPVIDKLQTLLAGDAQKNFTLFPFRIAKLATGSADVYKEDYLNIAVANLFGWAAYTLFDDVADGDEPASQLFIANVFHRFAFTLFGEVFPGNADWKAECDLLFSRMDAMNLEEQTAWRCPVKTSVPTPTFAYLTERSLGVLLAPKALIMKITNSSASLLKDAEQFLLHLIAARQLSDDAHDWEDDLAHGRINSASARIFASLPGDSAIDEQRKTFWDSVIDVLTNEVKHHCDTARKHAASFPSEQQELVEKFLAPLTNGMDKALKERNRTKEFLETYTKN